MVMLISILVLFQLYNEINCFRNQFYSKEDILIRREEVRKIFQHAYDGYLNHASDYDELRPLTCDGVNTWGSYSLTLIDALDTLAVMGNFTEFRRVVQYLIDNSNFDSDINVSVFETNIRIVGGLLSAHLMSRRAGIEVEPGWPCNGPLLRMAEDVARRLLPAFDTKTGMPYGTVNLRYGVPAGETPVTCTAGVGTFLVEFGSLSRLTGDPIYEEVALNAIYSLWKYRSPIGLFGNHIDVQTGRWTAQDSGIGAGVDSYFEYLVKGAILLNRPDLLEMFHESRKAIDKYMRKEDWYVWVSMTKAQITLPVFQSLEAFWPGVLSTIGDIESATKTFAKYHSVWKQYGFLPEFYNIPNLEATANRESYPLRPEIIESAMFLYRATKDQYFLEFGDDMLTSIQHSARTECGYATIKNVRTHERENRMESFFLAETTKYLYLLFDPDNFIHNDGSEGIVFETSNGQCILEAGNYIFNTEAHPIDPSALHCCHTIPTTDIFADFDIDNYKGEILNMESRKRLLKEREELEKKFECPEIIPRNANITVDIEFVTEIEANFSDTQKLLGQLTKQHPKNKLENNQNFNDEDKMSHEFEKDMWKDLETFLDNKYKNNTDSIQYINPLDLADILKILMKKVTLKTTTPNPIHSDQVFNNLYDLFMQTQKNKVSKTILSELDKFYKNFSAANKNKIPPLLSDLNDILTEILIASKSNFTGFDFNKGEYYQEMLKILENAQFKYEKAIDDPAEIYSFIMRFGNETLAQEKHPDISSPSILNLINLMQITPKNETNETVKNITLNYEIFESFIILMKLKQELHKGLNELKEFIKENQHSFDNKSENTLKTTEDEKNSESQSEKEFPSSEKTDDDIIVAENIKRDYIKQSEVDEGFGSVEQVPLVEEDFHDLENSKDDLIKTQTQDKIDEQNKKEKISEEINKKIDDTDLRLQSPQIKSYGSSETSSDTASLLTDFVQSILRSTLPVTTKFEPQILLEKIRSSGDYMKFDAKWELFSCKAPSFLQKLYVHGLF